MPGVTIKLSAAVPADLNAALGAADKRIAMGGSSATLIGYESLWGYSDAMPGAFLTLSDDPVVLTDVPLSAAAPLLLAGVAGLGLLGRRKARRG